MLVPQELRGVRGACEALEQTVLHLKQRPTTEATRQVELAGERICMLAGILEAYWACCAAMLFETSLRVF